MDGVPCQQPVQMALHIVDVQDLQLTVIQLQGDKVHIEGLADVRKDLVQHRRLPYIFPPGPDTFRLAGKGLWNSQGITRKI